MQFGVGFVAPFVVIVGAYAALGVRLRRLLSAGSKAAVKRPGRAMTRTTLVVTVAFLVTQLPFYVMELLHADKKKQVASWRAAAAAAAAASNFSVHPHQHWASAAGALTTQPAPPAFAISPAEMQLYVWLNAISKMLVFLSCCINPIIYGLLNHNYSQFFIVVCLLTVYPPMPAQSTERRMNFQARLRGSSSYRLGLASW